MWCVFERFSCPIRDLQNSFCSERRDGQGVSCQYVGHASKGLTKCARLRGLRQAARSRCRRVQILPDTDIPKPSRFSRAAH